MSPQTIAVIAVNNDQRPDFVPTRSTTVTDVPAGAPAVLLRQQRARVSVARPAGAGAELDSLCDAVSFGVARQFGSDMALDVDYVNTKSRDEKFVQDNVNITFDPATGIPYPFSDPAHHAFPQYGLVGMFPMTGRSDYHGLQTNFTKRMSHRWQGSLTYTLSGLWDQDPAPVSGYTQVPFPVAPDLGGERSFAETDQRHRLVFNGIWQVGYGLQVSGIYFYGSGLRTQATCGCDARRLQITSVDRLRLDGTIIPREAFVGQPIHRVELRLRNVCRSAAAGRSTVSWKCSTCSIGRTTGLRHVENQSTLGSQPERESILRAADPAAGFPVYVLTSR
jgi:hypothetical protein